MGGRRDRRDSQLRSLPVDCQSLELELKVMGKTNVPFALDHGPKNEFWHIPPLPCCTPIAYASCLSHSSQGGCILRLYQSRVDTLWSDLLARSSVQILKYQGAQNSPIAAMFVI